MKKIIGIIVATFLTVVLSPAWAVETTTSLQSDPYYMSLMQIGIRKSQSKDFKNLINDYTLNRLKAINRERNSTVERNFTLAVKKLRIEKGKAFSQAMKALLSEQQYARFHPFQVQLDKVLKRKEDSSGGYDKNNAIPENETTKFF
ncbi:MAG: hypothetical protein ACI9WS_001123 [Paraglaciecola psychrophila]|jgi:hypothetical protein